MNISLSPFAPENLVSRDGFGRPVPLQPAKFSTLRLNLVLTHEIPPDFHGGGIFFFFCHIGNRNRAGESPTSFVELCTPTTLESFGDHLDGSRK